MDNYYVYKLYHSTHPEFYIGSTKDVKKRMSDHKQHCKEGNSIMKVHTYIRTHGGFDEWKYELLEHITTSINKYDLRQLERNAIETLKPSLNKNIPNRSKREYERQYCSIKFQCECGGKYSGDHRARHFKSNKHRNHFNI